MDAALEREAERLAKEIEKDAKNDDDLLKA